MVGCEKLRKGEGLKNELEQDLENTVGSWELYGYEDEKRYPYLQSEFFERAAAPLTRRSNIVAFIFGGATKGWGELSWTRVLLGLNASAGIKGILARCRACSH